MYVEKGVEELDLENTREIREKEEITQRIYELSGMKISKVTKDSLSLEEMLRYEKVMIEKYGVNEVKLQKKK